MSKRSARRNKHNGNGHLLSTPTTQQLDQVAEIVERVVGVDESRQPRFALTNPTNAFQSVFNWVKIAALKEEPDARTSIRDWDKWLREFVLKEPYLAGVFNSVVQIDKNRGWNLIGGRNQVLRYSTILHNADNGAGWRNHVSWLAQSYYSTRMGAVCEVGSEGENGPLRAIWAVDSARAELMLNKEFPLRYHPLNGSAQDWAASDYFRFASLTSIDESQRGYGYPANARCFELAKIMVAVWEHDKEQLGARAPRGLLLLRGINQDQWDTAMTAREENLNAYERKYYGGIATLASSGVEEIDAKLFALSTLPKDFSLKEWVSLLMYGYALAYGYDPREFFPVDSGDLGSAHETEVQHRKASSKGDLDYALAHQEQLQSRLPATLQFEYEQRDASGEQLDATLALSKAQVITEINKWVVAGANVLTAEQIIQLAAEAEIIPQEWTEQEEDVTIDDSDATEAEERVLSLPSIQRALSYAPDEPIVIYRSRNNSITTLYDPLQQRKHWRSVFIARSIDSVEADFCDELHGLIESHWRKSKGNIAARVKALLTDYVEQAYVEGAKEGGVSVRDFDEEDAANIDRLILDQVSHVDGFVEAVNNAKAEKELRDGVRGRANLWCQAIRAAGTSGLNAAKANEMVEFGGDDGEEMCETCAGLKGKRHRRSWWEKNGLVPGQPGNTNFKCGGFNCRHTLNPV